MTEKESYSNTQDIGLLVQKFRIVVLEKRTRLLRGGENG